MDPDVRGRAASRTVGVMTTTDITHHSAGDAGPTNQRSFVERAAACGPVLQRHAAKYDHDGTWVHESFEHIRDAGLLAIAVPTELGGDGATISDVAAVQRELAKHCGSTALASAMHQHVTAFTAWRYGRNLPARKRRCAASPRTASSSSRPAAATTPTPAAPP